MVHFQQSPKPVDGDRSEGVVGNVLEGSGGHSKTEGDNPGHDEAGQLGPPSNLGPHLKRTQVILKSCMQQLRYKEASVTKLPASARKDDIAAIANQYRSTLSSQFVIDQTGHIHSLGVVDL